MLNYLSPPVTYRHYYYIAYPIESQQIFCSKSGLSSLGGDMKELQCAGAPCF